MTKETPITNAEKLPQTIGFQNSGFGILSSFDIRYSDFLMHLHLARADAAAIEMELHFGMIREQ